MRFLKYTLYIIIVMLAFIIQSVPCLMPEICGGRAVLLIPAAVCIAVFEDDITSMIFAVICGYFTDCSYSGTVGFYTVCLVVICYIISVLTYEYIQTNIITVLCVSFFAVSAVITMQFMLYYLAKGYDCAWQFFLKHYVSRMIYTFAFVPVFYGIIRLLNSTFHFPHSKLITG